MRRIGRRGMQVLWVVHVAVAGVWIGAGVAVLALAAFSLGFSGESALAAWRDIAALDRGIAAVAALSTLATGLVYGLGTAWGFVKHRWVTAKWLIALGVVFSGVAVVNTSAHAQIALLQHPGAAPATYAGHAYVVIACLAVQVAALFSAIVLSKLKPWRADR